ncbi:putative glycosyltransferase, partial [Nocardioides sp. PD653]
MPPPLERDQTLGPTRPAREDVPVPRQQMREPAAVPAGGAEADMLGLGDHDPQV